MLTFSEPIHDHVREKHFTVSVVALPKGRFCGFLLICCIMCQYISDSEYLVPILAMVAALGAIYIFAVGYMILIAKRDRLRWENEGKQVITGYDGRFLINFLFPSL